MGCLVASVSVATTHGINGLEEANLLCQPKPSSARDGKGESELEGCAIEIVEKSLELFNVILGTVRQSTRAGGHILQNFTMMGM